MTHDFSISIAPAMDGVMVNSALPRDCFSPISSAIKPVRTHLSRHRTQSTHAQQVVGRAGESGQMLRTRHTLEARLAQPADRLTPAEDLFDPLPDNLADLVATRARGATIQARRRMGLVHRHVEPLPQQGLRRFHVLHVDQERLVRASRPGVV